MTANLAMTYGKVFASSCMWHRACVTNPLPKEFTQAEPEEETPKSKKEKQEKSIWANPRLHRTSSTKLVLSLAQQSKRRVYLRRAQQAASHMVPLSYSISIIYPALPSYQPHSALKCQRRPHISLSTQTAPGKHKKCPPAKYPPCDSSAATYSACSTLESEFCCKGGLLSQWNAHSMASRVTSTAALERSRIPNFGFGLFYLWSRYLKGKQGDQKCTWNAFMQGLHEKNETR